MKNNSKRIIIISILLLFILMPTVLSAKTITTQVGDEGLDIKFPPRETYKQFDNITLHFHVYNVTDGIWLFDDRVSCDFHMYNSTGDHIIQNPYLDFDPPGDFQQKLYNNLTTIGTFEYIIYCNTSSLGGFVNSQFTVTPSGESTNETDSLIAFAIIIGTLGLSFLFAWFGFKFAESEKTFVLSLFFMLMSLISIVYMLFASYMFVRDIMYSVTIQTAQLRLWFGVMLSMIGIAMISLLNLTVQAIKQIKKHKSIYKNQDGFDNPTNKDLYPKRL